MLKGSDCGVIHETLKEGGGRKKNRPLFTADILNVTAIKTLATPTPKIAEFHLVSLEYLAEMI